MRQFLVSASLSPCNRVICSAVDITDRKLAERVIQKAREDLERKVRERSESSRGLMTGSRQKSLNVNGLKQPSSSANRKLNMLSSITGNDIFNQITAIIMSVSRAEEMVKDPALL